MGKEFLSLRVRQPRFNPAWVKEKNAKRKRRLLSG